MNLVFISGNIATEPVLHKKQSKICVLDLVCKSARKKKEFHKIVCFGSLAEMAYAKLKQDMYVTIMGVLERKSYKQNDQWKARTQIVAKQFMVPLHPKFSDYFQLALLMAEGAEFEGEPSGEDQGATGVDGPVGGSPSTEGE